MKRALKDRIGDLERSTLPWGVWVATFVAFVVARNLLEGALGPKGSIGFVYFSSRSALMVLDHFLFFYVSLFLSFALLLSALAGESVGRVMKVMTPAWGLVLIPPVVDRILLPGGGMRITYITDFVPILKFFDPGAALERVSPGQRIEIAAACALALTYVRLKTKRWGRAVAAFALTYLVLAAHGLLPNAVARLSWVLSGHRSGPTELVYDLAYKSGGIVPDESRKLALLFLFTSTILAWAALRRFAPEKEGAFRSNARPLRTFHYLGMTCFGTALGWAVFAPKGVAVAGVGDVLGIAGTCLATFLAFQASVATNDLFDEEADRISESTRPLVSGALSRRDVIWQATALSLAAAVVALNVKYSTFLVVILALSLSFAYSAPPVRLKRFPVVSSLSLGLVSLVACLIGFSLFAEERSFALFPNRLAWLIVLSFGIGFAAKDLKDIEGDRATGVMTLPVLLGPDRGRIAVAILVAVSYLLVPALLPYPVLTAPAVLLGAWSATMVFVWKRPRLDQILLAGCLAFTVAVAARCVLGIERLQAGEATVVEAKALEFHGRRAEALADWPKAAEAYRMAAERLPDSVELRRRAGINLFNAGRFEEAREALAWAVAVDPADPLAWQHLALAEQRLGHLEAAVRLLRDSIARKQRPAVCYALLGELYLSTGEPGRAAKAFSNALTLGQPGIPARLRLADALVAMGRPECARAEYERAVSDHPRSAEARDALGKFYDVAGEHDRAAAEFREAVRLAPDEPVFWNNLGVALRLGRHFDDAMAALAEATRLAPRMVDPYYNRGKIYEAVGRTAEARNQHLLALELDPSFSPARTALENLGPPPDPD